MDVVILFLSHVWFSVFVVVVVYLKNLPLLMRERNSRLVLGSSLNEPFIALVTVFELTFSTLRITIHK
jgi:hypothetical protein